jgi:hypothetical protein
MFGHGLDSQQQEKGADNEYQLRAARAQHHLVHTVDDRLVLRHGMSGKDAPDLLAADKEGSPQGNDRRSAQNVEQREIGQPGCGHAGSCEHEAHEKAKDHNDQNR